MAKIKIFLIAIFVLLVLFLINPLWGSLFRLPVVAPTILMKGCPKNYSHPLDMTTGKEDFSFCQRNLDVCLHDDVWQAKEKDCTPNMIGCTRDIPCNCNGRWERVDNLKWQCKN